MKVLIVMGIVIVVAGVVYLVRFFSNPENYE